MSLQDFLKASKQNDDDFWFFLHIPKTAGSSISNELAASLPPYRNIHVDYSDNKTPHNEKLRKTVKSFVKENADDKFRSASGHLSYDYYTILKEAFPKTKTFTFLRNPVDRVVSDFRYQRTPMHPPHEKFIEDFPTIEKYVEAPRSQNKMARFLTDVNKATSNEEIVDNIINEFEFIGTLEMYPMSFHCVTQLSCGEGKFPKLHARKTPDNSVTHVDRTPELNQLIRENNKLDILLYETVAKLLRKHRDSWRESVGAK